MFCEPVCLEHFEHELKILEHLGIKHPNIVEYYSLGENTNTKNPLRITEYLEGMPLAAYLSKMRTTLSLENRLDLMLQICQVVEILHKYNIGYFLDIDNIWVTNNNVIKVRNLTAAYSCFNWDELKGENKRLPAKKILMLDEIADKFRTVCGTMDRNLGEEGDTFDSERADVYSLGFVLYRVLMDKFPFSPNCWTTLDKATDADLLRLWTIEGQSFLQQGGTIAKMLAQLLLKCFTLETSRRPFVEWVVVILAETRASLRGLYF